MPSLKPIDHQNIVLRLLATAGPAQPEYLTKLAHGLDLPVSLHQLRLACDALVNQQLAALGAGRYRLTEDGAREALFVPLLGSYYTTGGTTHAAE
ncbi:hypothetical protein Q9247_09570 [Halomonas meridiana]|uniref:hypothetical protein n=1 Tax=Vreelandella TaxID=3137766 RepID=UPI00273AC453|nr:hypothetical protein [Halomonas meridiana]MDP4557931.1 hypothetical protein [Halomonas meridiana]